MKKKILIVEDEVDIQNMVKIRLEHAGYECIIAGNGEEGLKCIDLESPDLIISDVMMPIMDGFAFYKQLKSKEDTKNIPVIILTARQQMKDSFLVLGADAFVSKPFEAQTLLDKVEKLLRIHEPSSQATYEDADDDLNLGTEASEIDKKISDAIIKSENVQEGSKLRRVLVAGSEMSVIDIMTRDLKELGCETRHAVSGAGVVEEILQYKPSILLLEFQIKTVSAFEIIDKLKSVSDLNVQILLYAYFKNKDAAKDSITRNLFSEYSNEFSESSNQPVSYFGVFREETFKFNIKEYLIV